MFLVFSAVPLWPQLSSSAGGEPSALPLASPSALPATDPVSFIGMTLTETLRRFGVPRSVYAVRGLEEWQDDVVFVCDEADFYIYKDRVWQAGLKEVRGIKTGDPGAVVSLILGAVERRENSLFCFLNEGAWPLMLRFDLNNTGAIKAIFIYRTDL